MAGPKLQSTKGARLGDKGVARSRRFQGLLVGGDAVHSNAKIFPQTQKGPAFAGPLAARPLRDGP
jgi:hypothetical protein